MFQMAGQPDDTPVATASAFRLMVGYKLAICSSMYELAPLALAYKAPRDGSYLRTSSISSSTVMSVSFMIPSPMEKSTSLSNPRAFIKFAFAILTLLEVVICSNTEES